MLIASKCPCCESGAIKKEPAVLMPFISYRVFGWEPVRVEGFKDLHSGLSYVGCNTYICQCCLTRFLDMRFHEWEMKRLYKDYMQPSYIADRLRFEPSFDPIPASEPRKYKDKVEEFIHNFIPLQSLNILDYGSSNLKNTPFVNNYNEIELYDLGYDSPKREYYDLINCMHVLEHDPYPLTTLQIIKQYMHERTLFYIEVPLEKEKNYWHEHINQFNIYSMQKMLKISGFRIIKTQTLDEKPSGSMIGILQLLCCKAERS